MPLIHSDSREAIAANIKEMLRNHPRAQAIAAALNTARRYASGGGAGGTALDGTHGSSVDLSALTPYVPQTVTSQQAGILPSGLMATPQTGSYRLDPTSGALTAATRSALQNLAQRGLTIAGPPPPAVAPDPEVPAAPISTALDPSDPSVAYGNRAAGGSAPSTPFYTRSEAHGMDHPSGLIMSPIGGRSDHLPMHLGSGSYVIPADVMSGIGQGNTMAGGHTFDQMIHGGPYGTLPMPKLGGTMAKPRGMPRMVAARHFARGGRMRGRVPVIVAGGERIVSPDEVARLSGGDIKKGHAMLDRWVVDARKHILKHTAKLPGPVKS